MLIVHVDLTIIRDRILQAYTSIDKPFMLNLTDQYRHTAIDVYKGICASTSQGARISISIDTCRSRTTLVGSIDKIDRLVE